MKLSILRNLFVFTLLLCFSVPHVFAAPANGKPAKESETTTRLPLITKDNFISFFWAFSSDSFRYLHLPGDSPPAHASFKVRGKVLEGELQDTDKTKLTINLSNNQVNALIAKLNNVRFNKEYKEHTEYPDIVFTLVFSDKNNEDKNEDFVFFNDTAKSNLNLEKHLRKLVQMKFIDFLFVPPDEINNPNSNNK